MSDSWRLGQIAHDARTLTRSIVEDYSRAKISFSLLVLGATVYLGSEVIEAELPDRSVAATAWSLAEYSFFSVTENPRAALVVCLAYVAVFVADALRPLHARFVRNELLVPRRQSLGLRRLEYSATLLVGVSLLIVVPLLALHRSWLSILAASLFVSAPTISAYAIAFKRDYPILARIPRLSDLHFDPGSFAIAEMGVESREAKYAVEEYEAKRSKGARSPEVLKLIREGGISGWPGITGFFSQLAAVIGDTSADNIELCDRTLQAVRRSIEEVASASTSPQWIMKPDCLFPEVRRIVERAAASYALTPIPVAVHRDIMSGATGREVAERVAAELNGLSGRGILVISHVLYDVGTVIDIAALRQSMSRPEDVIVIVDGAQALGQIEIGEAVLTSSDYYATCTHKWALGRANLGVLWRNRARLQGLGIVSAPLDRGFSTLASSTAACDAGAACPPEQVNGVGTIALEPYFSASIALGEVSNLGVGEIQKHNERLAAMLRRGIERRNLGHCVRTEPSSAIVAMIPHSDAKPSVGTVIDAGDARLIRLCPHYFNSDSDVLTILAILERDLV